MGGCASADVGHDPDRRAGTVVQRHDHERDSGRPATPFLNQGAASATFGNLLTLPMGGGLLYVTPVYTQRQGSTGSTALRFVVVRFGQSVGIGTPCSKRWTRCSREAPVEIPGKAAVPMETRRRARLTIRPQPKRSARRRQLYGCRQGADGRRSRDVPEEDPGGPRRGAARLRALGR